MAIHSSQTIDLEVLLKSKQPIIDLKLDQFEASTTAFLNAVIKFTNDAVEEITTRKAKHVQEMKRIVEKQKETEVETLECKMQEIKLMEGMR